jgi:2-oxoglutarate dehydrogenase E1 component
MDKYSYISNAHTAYIDELYKAYRQNPESVDYSWQKFFEGFDFSLEKFGEKKVNGSVNGHAKEGVSIKEVLVSQLIHAYRSRAHLKSKTNPVRTRKDRKALLDLRG